MRRAVEQCNQGLQIHAMAGDVRDRAQVQDIVKHTVEQHGGLDIIIANAGALHSVRHERNLPHTDMRQLTPVIKLSESNFLM